MRIRTISSVIAGPVLLAAIALGQSNAADCKPGTPQKIDGKVVKVDPNAGKITVQDSSGATHEFEATQNTLKEYKVGDSIKAKLREC
jgi:Cu/Ag efflux protein CusF